MPSKYQHSNVVLLALYRGSRFRLSSRSPANSFVSVENTVTVVRQFRLLPCTAAYNSLNSEFAGQLLRVDDGEGIFLDVGLLSEVINPILDHKLPGRGFRPGPLNEWRNTLVTTGVLSPAFARHLWGNTFLGHAPQSSSSQFESALFEVLIKLGVAFPLGRVPLPEAVHGSQTAPAYYNSGIHTQRDMLVWRWLPETLGDHGEATFKAIVEQLGDGAQEVTLKWEFDSAGAPHGLMERLIALCHVIGEAEMALCWRSGAVFQGPPVAEGTHPPYVVELRYCDTDRVLSVTMFGTLRSGRVWAVLRFVASLMVNISKDWPGALWAGWVKCSDHPLRRLYLATPTEVCAHCRFVWVYLPPFAIFGDLYSLFAGLFVIDSNSRMDTKGPL